MVKKRKNKQRLFSGILILLLFVIGIYFLYNKQPLGGFGLLFVAGILYIFRKEIFGRK